MAIYVTLVNCVTTGIGARRFIIYFDYALFSDKRFFGRNEDLSEVNYFFNNWDEFNHSQGFKSEARYKRNEEVFGLKNGVQIKFRQSLDGHYLFNEDKIFDRLFFCGEGEINEDEMSEINDGLKNVLSKYFNKIFIKNSESHRWFISLNGNLSLNVIPRASYYLTVLITCLTHDFNASLEAISIVSKSEESGHSNEFHLLYYQSAIKLSKSHYSNINSPIKKGSFSEEEWNVVLDNLFVRIFNQEDLLDNFFFALQENHFGGESATAFCITRAIDCLAGIADYKGYERDSKYQEAIKWFLDGLDHNTQRIALQFIDEKLDYLTVPTINPRTRKSYSIEESRGIRLSSLRTISVHFIGNNNTMDLHKGHALLYVFELMIIDFIFEQLKVPKVKRNDYKKFYLERVSWF